MKRKQILNYALIFGSLAGVACFLFFLAMYSTKPNPLALRRPDIGINVIMIWASIWYFKRNNGGYLHFYEAFSIGFLTNIIGALISGILVYLFIEFIDDKPFIDWMIHGKSLLLKDKEMFEKILNEKSYRQSLISFDTQKHSVIITDDLLFKQIAIVAISLFGMSMRKLNN
ncbi:MAG: hypothetical protein CFE22_07460 [Cytophagaceae bacterium BCCC1]|nr:MAG: hypothetical protein CFE22_07460 [Cytophagaceae bacterium BCCC1]